jgi:hypothetical protein
MSGLLSADVAPGVDAFPKSSVPQSKQFRACKANGYRDTFHQIIVATIVAHATNKKTTPKGSAGADSVAAAYRPMRPTSANHEFCMSA